MNKILILSLFISQIAFGQRQIQHEPERIFNMLIIGKSTTVYAKEKGLKKVHFYRDSILSSSMEFDKNGNFITTVGMENNVIKKTTYKWDDQDRLIETKYYSRKDTSSYGYYYRYINGAQLMFKIEDSLLFRKETFLKEENIRTYSEYDTTGIVISKSVYVKNKKSQWLLETRFQYDHIYVQYRYEYLDNKKYVTKVQFDKNGTKRSEKRYLDEIRNGNELEHYTSDEERLFRIDSLDKNDNLLKMVLLDKNGNITNTKILKYDSKGQLTIQTKIDLTRNQKIKYGYQYDKLGRIKLVIKEFNGVPEIFRYSYEKY